MDIEKFQAELFSILEKQFSELEFEFELVSDSPASQVGSTLLFLMPVTERGGKALTELRFLSLDDDNCNIMIYSTIFTDLGSGYDELLKSLNTLNYFTGMGAFGVLPEKRVFWNKYTFPIRDTDFIDGALAAASALLDALDLFRSQITDIYGIIAAIASGSLTFETAVSSGQLPRL